ncbi:serpentine type 7TM GPCR receptor class ab chemoreceptor domain-containing protein [Ditylenchus destructor]|uniref:Serpentine type 7TM GPCR receptor class ab chemoreceptor domain-containing protein n=1 Tax=Ditylenchus destructor TaxID=166010 RepID=A0AAD4R9L4_9BILA|nr:serpentine type 7TM GPCR receptor class ab chemoreceptor domain-containing protein [Ditylenchus destructor]
MGRSLLALLQMITQSYTWYTWNSVPLISQMEHFQEINCYDLNVMPTAFCAFISVAGIILCMERLYATFNYTKYEYEDFAPFLTKLFILMVNKERQEIYIRHHYNSLSSRFQIGENIKGVRLMIWFIASFLVAVALILVQTVYNWNISNEKNMSPSARMLSQELTLLILPVFTVVMPMRVIMGSVPLKSRAKSALKDVLNFRQHLACPLYWASSLRKKVNIGGIHGSRGSSSSDMPLQEYWDDYMHLK